MKQSVHNKLFFIGTLLIALFCFTSRVSAQSATDPVQCLTCLNSSVLVTCTNCKGTGIVSGKQCGNCKGSGQLHKTCQHAYEASFREVPEMVFRNPVLEGGTANKEGAQYRFPAISPGLDALLRLKKFSSPSVVMLTVDNATFGHDKAFQPEFGINPVVANQTWWIDFEMIFVEAGTTKPIVLDRFQATSLDVDGDNFNVGEYVQMNNAMTTTFSGSSSYLATNTTTSALSCSKGTKVSAPVKCTACNGLGKVFDKKSYRIKKCDPCKGAGKLFTGCGHPYEGELVMIKGPTDNFANIDTASTQVMAYYEYANLSTLTFRVGGISGNKSGGAGIRLNSLWFKAFNMQSATPLPVKLIGFTAALNQNGVTLNWSSAGEENFSHYVVEHSNDGKSFSELATVFPNDGATQRNYSIKDKQVPATGIKYYRLRFVDKTNEIAYSDVRVIRFTKGGEPALSLAAYPNPVQDQLRVTLPNAWQGKAVVLELYNSNGTRVQSIRVPNASQTETMSIGSVARGFYVVKASCDTEAAHERIVKN